MLVNPVPRRARRETHPEDAEDNEEHDLEEVPISIVSDLEQHEFPAAIRVHGREGDSRYQGAEETSPHGLDTENTTHFLMAYRSITEWTKVATTRTYLNGEQDASNGRAKGDRDASGTRSRQNLAHLH